MLIVALAGLYVVAMYVAAHLIRSGRVSNRTGRLLVVGLAPAFAIAYALWSDAAPIVIVLALLATVLAAAPLYMAFGLLIPDES